MKLIILITLSSCSLFLSSQQDLEIIFQTTWTHPQTFCDHGGPQDNVRLTVKNNSGSGTNLGVRIRLNYRINGGTIVRDSIAVLGGGATWQFDFVNRQEDFSACGDTFDIETWVEYALDTDNSNDTLAYQFINFCSPTSGTLFMDSTYQNTTDLDTLLLLNSDNTTNYLWQYSLDSLNWQDVFVNDTILPISYVDTLRYYRVVTTNSECPATYSNPVVIRFLDPTLSVYESGRLDFKLFPNPSSDYVYFSSKQKTSVVIYDLKGKLVYSQLFKKGTHKVLIQEWEQGVYLIYYKSKSNSGFDRIIKI